MANKLDLNEVQYQDQLRSKPVRENYRDIQTEFNTLLDEFNASVASTATEVTNARDYYDYLQNNIHARRIYGNGIISGGVITATAGNQLAVTAGYGIVPSGEGVNFTAAVSDTVGEVSATRWVVAVANSDNSVSLEFGDTASDPVLPDLLDSQRALATVFQATGTVNFTDIQDARRQGAMVDGEKYYWKIQDAIDSLSNTYGGYIDIGNGRYYEEIDITGKNNLTLNFAPGAELYRINATASVLVCENTAGSVTQNVLIKGGQCYGGDATGSEPLVNIKYLDKWSWENMFLDGNTGASGTYTNFVIATCNNFRVNGVQTDDGSGDISDTNYNISGSRFFVFNNGARMIRDNFDLVDELLIYEKIGGFDK